MEVFLVFLGVITLILIGIVIIGKIVSANRKKEFKDWQKGDLLILKPSSKYSSILTKNGKDLAVLEGWTEDNLYIDCHAGYISKVSWDELSVNKSALWRRNYDEAKKVMGVDPGFSRVVSVSSVGKTSGGKTYDGKVIELLNEIECQVYLKKALEDEDFEVAELIKKRLEKFR